MPPIPHHPSQKVVKKCKIAAKAMSLGRFFGIIVVWGDGDAKKLD